MGLKSQGKLKIAPIWLFNVVRHRYVVLIVKLSISYFDSKSTEIGVK